jgi:hypothetical protein
MHSDEGIPTASYMQTLQCNTHFPQASHANIKLGGPENNIYKQPANDNSAPDEANGH